MPKQSKSDEEKLQRGIKIFAYGFDAAGFQTPKVDTPFTEIGTVRFISLEDATSLDSADGVIIPQGICEKIEHYQNVLGTYTNVRVYEALLLQREKEVFNLLGEGKWVCFLVGKIVDSVPQGLYNLQDIRDTDLCKRLLNAFGVHREIVDGLTFLNSKDNEFISYVRDYGVAKTVLKLPYAKDIERRVIVEAGGNVCGVEFSNKLFFLPFHTSNRDASTAASIVKTVSQAILDYRQKRAVEIPAWADEFQFNSEEALSSKISSLIGQANKLQGELYSWRDYKTILTTSGDILKKKLIRILEDFFQLKVDPLDENREDAKIIDKDGKTLVMIEVKGTKAGVKREYINQVDSHRERNGLPISIPGVLFIDNEMSVNGINERLATKVPDEQIKHARNLNVTIVRTIDLLFLMRHLESDPDRKDVLMRLLSEGGGWLKVDLNGYEIVSCLKR